jgi:hypothetical protein
MPGRAVLLVATLALAGCGSKKSGSADPPAGAGSTAGSATPPGIDAAAVTAPPTTDPPPPDDVAAWRANLDVIAAELPKRHPAPFTRTDEETFRLQVEDLAGKLAIMDRDQRITSLARIVALIGDPHTQLHLGPLARAEVYPVRLYWFTDGIVITEAAAPHAWAVGARVVSVGGRPIDDAGHLLATTFGWEAEGWRRAEIAWRLTWPTFMRGAGLVAAGAPARFGVVDASGAERELVLEPTAWKPTAPAATLPLYRQRPASFYWSKPLPDERALYVQYNKCADAPDLSFADFTRTITAGLDGVDRLIIDLRLNGGGDSRVIQPLLDAIAARPRLKGRVFVLISRHTFSSGLTNALQLDYLGAVLVGEPAGSPASHFGEVKLLPLPHHGFTLQHSTKRFDHPNTDPIAVAPEVLVELASADWLGGKDPVLTAALAHPLATP